jgi:hypothetical protein
MQQMFKHLMQSISFFIFLLVHVVGCLNSWHNFGATRAGEDMGHASCSLSFTPTPHALSFAHIKKKSYW